MTARYVLHHEDAWFYYLPEDVRGWRPAVIAADGQPMTSCDRRGWYAADHEAAVVTVTQEPSDRVTGYRLADPSAASARFPLTLTPAEWQARREADEDGPERNLYERVTEPCAPEATEVPGPWIRLDGEPPPADGRGWVADLPFELSTHPEYRHLFPGYMPGFREAMTAALKVLPRVTYVFDAKRFQQVWGLEITLAVPFDSPVTEYVPARNRDGSVSRSRKGRTVPSTATRRLEIAVPYVIRAENRAEAAAEWDQRQDDLIAAVTAASVEACARCHGHGYVISGSEEFEREVKSS